MTEHALPQLFSNRTELKKEEENTIRFFFLSFVAPTFWKCSNIMCWFSGSHYSKGLYYSICMQQLQRGVVLMSRIVYLSSESASNGKTFQSSGPFQVEISSNTVVLSHSLVFQNKCPWSRLSCQQRISISSIRFHFIKL